MMHPDESGNIRKIASERKQLEDGIWEEAFGGRHWGGIIWEDPEKVFGRAVWWLWETWLSGTTWCSHHIAHVSLTDEGTIRKMYPWARRERVVERWVRVENRTNC